MTWSSYWLPRLVDWIGGAAVSATVAAAVGLVVRHQLRRLAVQWGIVDVAPPPASRWARVLRPAYGAPQQTSRGKSMGGKGVRKAIAAGAGVLLIGLLEWATTSTQLEQAVEAVVPGPLVPIVPIVVGGLATVLAVYRASNVVSPPASTLDVPAPPDEHRVVLDAVDVPAGTVPAAPVASPPTVRAVAGAAGAPIVTGPVWWRGTPAGEPEASTAIVELQPVRVPSYQ